MSKYWRAWFRPSLFFKKFKIPCSIFVIPFNFIIRYSLFNIRYSLQFHHSIFLVRYSSFPSTSSFKIPCSIFVIPFNFIIRYSLFNIRYSFQFHYSKFLVRYLLFNWNFAFQNKIATPQYHCVKTFCDAFGRNSCLIFTFRKKPITEHCFYYATRYVHHL